MPTIVVTLTLSLLLCIVGFSLYQNPRVSGIGVGLFFLGLPLYFLGVFLKKQKAVHVIDGKYIMYDDILDGHCLWSITY